MAGRLGSSRPHGLAAKTPRERLSELAYGVEKAQRDLSVGILEARRDGLTLAAIARELGVSHQAVSARLRRLELAGGRIRRGA